MGVRTGAMSKVIFRDWGNVNDVHQHDLDELIDFAQTAADQRARVCMHRTEADPVQEMVIAMTGRSYVRPHRQRGFEKSYVMLLGELQFIFFDESGVVLQSRRLAADGVVVTRFDASLWHTARTVGEERVAVYLETIRGPFMREHTDWAQWAPEAGDLQGVARFLQQLPHPADSSWWKRE